LLWKLPIDHHIFSYAFCLLNAQWQSDCHFWHLALLYYMLLFLLPLGEVWKISHTNLSCNINRKLIFWLFFSILLLTFCSCIWLFLLNQGKAKPCLWRSAQKQVNQNTGNLSFNVGHFMYCVRGSHVNCGFSGSICIYQPILVNLSQFWYL